MPREFRANATEDGVEDYLVKRVEGVLRGSCHKKPPLFRRGWPDRVCYYDTALVDWIETKRPRGGVFEPLQLRIQGRLRDMGYRVYTLYNKAEIDEYVESTRALLDIRRKSLRLVAVQKFQGLQGL